MHSLFKRFVFRQVAGGRRGGSSGARRRRVVRSEVHRQLGMENLESRQLLATVVSGMELMHDTGVSATDRITREAAVSGSVGWTTPETTQVAVEFDHNGDGQAEGTVTTSWSGTAFTYDPLATDAALSTWDGPLTLRYRTLTSQASGSVVGVWQDFSMTLDRVAPIPLEFIPTTGDVMTSTPDSITVTFDESLAVSSVQGTSLELVSSSEGPIWSSEISLPISNQVEATIVGGSLNNADYTTYAMSVSDLAGNWYYGGTTVQWPSPSGPPGPPGPSGPSASMIAPIAVLEDAESTTINLFEVFHDAETADQDLVLAITQNTNPGLFSSVSINATTGELTLDYAPDAYGTGVLTVQATDEQNLTVATNITVVVASVNDPPRIVDFVGIEGHTYWTFTGRIVDESPSGLLVTFGGLLAGVTATSGSAGMFEVQAIITQSGTVTAQTVDSANLASNLAVEYVVI